MVALAETFGRRIVAFVREINRNPPPAGQVSNTADVGHVNIDARLIGLHVDIVLNGVATDGGILSIVFDEPDRPRIKEVGGRNRTFAPGDWTTTLVPIGVEAARLNADAGAFAEKLEDFLRGAQGV